MDYKLVLGGVATIIGFVGYAVYLRDIVRGKTKPHIFSWAIWSLIGGIVFAAQILAGGGAGAWVNGLAAVAAFAVVVLSFSRGEKRITTIDWICFASAFAAIIMWQLTNTPFVAVLIVTVADTLAFVPTFRKSFGKPWEETLFEYVTAGGKYLISIPALGEWSPTTLLYPIVLVCTNFAFVTMVSLRRKSVV
ncbi:MAG: hypothetical protein AAB932_02575 [Patescibacteria group bacterium]